MSAARGHLVAPRWACRVLVFFVVTPAIISCLGRDDVTSCDDDAAIGRCIAQS